MGAGSGGELVIMMRSEIPATCGTGHVMVLSRHIPFGNARKLIAAGDDDDTLCPA
jgi:hypothetical protein